MCRVEAGRVEGKRGSKHTVKKLRTFSCLVFSHKRKCKYAYFYIVYTKAEIPLSLKFPYFFNSADSQTGVSGQRGGGGRGKELFS